MVETVAGEKTNQLTDDQLIYIRPEIIHAQLGGFLSEDDIGRREVGYG
jgi:hypothetical protein